MVHELKIWTDYFDAVKKGYKTFEYRFNDRNYQLHDILFLREYDPVRKVYSGRFIAVVVTYILLVGKSAIMSICPICYNDLE